MVFSVPEHMIFEVLVNGIDYDVFNPETDKCITRNYNAKTFRKEKVKNKIQLQKDLGLNEDPECDADRNRFPSDRSERI